MYILAVILLVFCLICSASAIVVKDDNAIVQFTFDNYYRALNASGTLTGCKPKIVRGVPNSSVIQPITGWRGNVAVIVAPGTCNTTDTFVCITSWGDSTSSQTPPLKGLLPCQLMHQYEKVDAHYPIHVLYCSATEVTSSGDFKLGPCDSYVRDIDTSYDPANPLNASIRGEL